MKTPTKQPAAKKAAKKAPAKKAAKKSAEKPQLLILPKDMRPHPLLGRAGLVPDLLEREAKLATGTGKDRGAHKETAESLEAELDAMVNSILWNGLREPLKVVREAGGWAIVDGRHRWQSIRELIHRHQGAHNPRALDFRTNGIPCVEVSADEVPAIIMDAATRRHLSKGALAYLAVLVHPAVAATTQGKRTDLTTSALSAEVLARNTGVSLRLMETAVSLYKLFLDRKDAKEKYEAGIWLGHGLSSIHACAQAYLTNAGSLEQETEAQKKARLASQATTTGRLYFQKITRYWTAEFARLDTAQAKAVADAAAATLLAAPPEIREAVKAALNEATTA
jgi:hypothetical protein